MAYGLAMIGLIAAATIVVVWPLTRAQDAGAEVARIEELEAAKEAKYREIRDAELDRGMGKLSEADFKAVDGELREEAIEILRELDVARGVSPEDG